MKLYYSPASPYVRKLLVLAHETGQADDITLVPVNTSPVKRDMEVVAENPIGKLPTLILDDGAALFDSRVCTRYLDTRHTSAPLYPEGAALWPVLTLEAMADGLLDALILVRYEQVLRPTTLQWGDWVDGQMAKAISCLDHMETQSAQFGSRLDAGVIAVACALGYLDFRFPDFDWRAGRTHLANWYAVFAERPSMRATWPAPLV